MTDVDLRDEAVAALALDCAAAEARRLGDEKPAGQSKAVM